MTTEMTRIAERLAKVAADLHAISIELGGRAEPPVPPPEAVATAGSGHCLQCGKEASKEKRGFRRGLCSSCYQSTLRRIEKTGVTWDELIGRGFAMPESPTGRPTSRKAVDDFLEERAKQIGESVGSEMAQAMRDDAASTKPKPKKPGQKPGRKANHRDN